MMLFSIIIADGIRARDVNAGSLVRRDHVADRPTPGRQPGCRAHRRCARHRRIAGPAVAEDVAAARGRADVVGLDEIPRGADPAQMNAVAVVRRDDIARARRLRLRSRCLMNRRCSRDRRPSRTTRSTRRPSRCRPEIKPTARRPDDADLVAENLVARCAGLDQDTLGAIAADHVGSPGVRCRPPSCWPSPARSLPGCCPARRARPYSATAAACPSASRPGRPGTRRSRCPGSGRPRRSDPGPRCRCRTLRRPGRG